MNQVYFYNIRKLNAALQRGRLNPFMNQVYFYWPSVVAMMDAETRES